MTIAFEVNDSRLSAKPVQLVHDDDVWENALETGALSIEHAAQRIKELHEQRQELLKKKHALEHNRPGVKTVSAIPTAHTDAYVAELQRRLAEKQIRAKRQFLQEVLKEVRVRGSNVTLTYKPLSVGSLLH